MALTNNTRGPVYTYGYIDDTAKEWAVSLTEAVAMLAASLLLLLQLRTCPNAPKCDTLVCSIPRLRNAREFRLLTLLTDITPALNQLAIWMVSRSMLLAESAKSSRCLTRLRPSNPPPAYRRNACIPSVGYPTI